MKKYLMPVISFILVIAISTSVISLVASAEENDRIVGTWETNFVFSASDLGVDGNDIVFRCNLTFKEDGTLITEWTAVDLSSIKTYFHQLFVNAYYACGFGAGYTNVDEIESICLASTGKSVTEYVAAFLDSFDMNVLFCPVDDEGKYAYGNKESEIYLDIMLMGLESNPSVANYYEKNVNKLNISANSFGQPQYVIHCSLKNAVEGTEVPETEPTLPENMVDKG